MTLIDLLACAYKDQIWGVTNTRVFVLNIEEKTCVRYMEYNCSMSWQASTQSFMGNKW